MLRSDVKLKQLPVANLSACARLAAFEITNCRALCEKSGPSNLAVP